jgi:hypothetical protein
MVDIIVGETLPLGTPNNRPPAPGVPVEAEILNIRDPRRMVQGPNGQERRKTFRQDPVNGRILTLLIPNSTILPKDLDGSKYRVTLRFVKK